MGYYQSMTFSQLHIHTKIAKSNAEIIATASYGKNNSDL